MSLACGNEVSQSLPENCACGSQNFDILCKTTFAKLSIQERIGAPARQCDQLFGTSPARKAANRGGRRMTPITRSSAFQIPHMQISRRRHTSATDRPLSNADFRNWFMQSGTRMRAKYCRDYKTLFYVLMSWIFGLARTRLFFRCAQRLPGGATLSRGWRHNKNRVALADEADLTIRHPIVSTTLTPVTDYHV
jgi:hypothetical protein